MFDIGFFELLLVFIIALLVLGPERLPHAAHTLGKWVGRARRMVSKFTQEIDKELEIEALKAKLKEQGKSLDINEDVRMIHKTVSNALSEAEADDDYGHGPHGDFEPLPRKENDKPFLASQQQNKPAVEQQIKSEPKTTSEIKEPNHQSQVTLENPSTSSSPETSSPSPSSQHK